MSEKPSQRHKFRAQASLTVSLLLQPAFKVCKQFGSRRSLIRWVYIHIPQERIFNPCMNLLNVSMNLSARHYFMQLGYLSHVTKAQTGLRKCAFSIQHSARSVIHIPASTQCQATIDPPAKCHPNGGSLAGRWWPAFRCVLR